MSRAWLALVGCVGCAPSLAALQRPVDTELTARLGDVRLDRDAVWIAERLGKPIDLDTAVRIALANNERVKAALAELEIAGSGLHSMLGPLAVEAELRDSRGGSELEVRVIQDLLGAITASRQRAAARSDLAGARAMAAATAIRLAGQVEIAFDDLLATQQEVELRQTAFDAADAAALLRERMHAAGNTTDLALARDRDAREQARIELDRAKASVALRHARLDALLGLTGDQIRWTTTGRLPELPATVPALDGLEDVAVSASLELAAGRARVTAAERRLGEQRLRSVLPHVGAGVSVTRQDGVSAVGPAIELGIPLLDWNGPGRARARGERRKAEHELAATLIELRASAHAARLAAVAAYGEARHIHDVVLPLRQQIVDQTVLHYNAMDADPFALIAARQNLVEAGRQYLEALRHYAGAMATVGALRRGVFLDPPTSDALH